MFDSKFTFERHIRSISSLFAQKIGLLRKSFRIFGNHDVLLRCFNSLILLVWSIAPLFGPLQLIPILNSLIRIYKLVNFLFQILQLVCSTVVLLAHCVLFTRSFITRPIFSILNFPTCSVPGVTRGSLSINSLTFSPMRFHTSQYSRYVIFILK